jgi:hypothetical protein
MSGSCDDENGAPDGDLYYRPMVSCQRFCANPLGVAFTRKGDQMKRFTLIVVIGAIYSTTVLAAPVDEHVRGKIVSVSPDTLVVRTSTGENVSVALNGETHYLRVVRSSLDQIEPNSYIGTATKNIGSTQVALEVMIFPAAMRGIKPGHHPYDRLPDTTLSGGTTSSMMTNGSVAVVATAPGASVNSAMTNGTVSTSASENGMKQLTVTYNGGQQLILVPPTAPIVNLLPSAVSDLSTGAYVFVDAAKDGPSLTAGLVAAGAEGLKPPF